MIETEESCKLAKTEQLQPLFSQWKVANIRTSLFMKTGLLMRLTITKFNKESDYCS